MQILLVADGRWVVEDITASLGEPRYEVSTVSESHDIVAACSEAGADVVVADMQIGAMGGMAVIREIRAAVAAGDLPPTPTVLLLDRGADAFIAGRAGADAWLRKPFGAFELRELLDGLAGEAAEPEAGTA
jgi:DNA-binding response OmpR family regulator